MNKLGHYFEDDDMNAIMPIIYNGKHVTTILDGGFCVSIITTRVIGRLGG